MPKHLGRIRDATGLGLGTDMWWVGRNGKIYKRHVRLLVLSVFPCVIGY